MDNRRQLNTRTDNIVHTGYQPIQVGNDTPAYVKMFCRQLLFHKDPVIYKDQGIDGLYMRYYLDSRHHVHILPFGFSHS